ncbi:MAG: DUF1553 domain-containing protein [Planctomycetaceae bacterium]|nr:DUF1553 domain-containing protein [Planctomycetaceae bacterium]
MAVCLALTLPVGAVRADEGGGGGSGSAVDAEFFESRIRPVLIEHCYSCHNSIDTAESGLAVDHREALRKGGDHGPVLVVGKPGQSRLLATLRHEIEGLEMPQGGPKLEDSVLRDFERWIADGAFDPRDEAPSAEELAKATSWEATLEKRRQWWSFQPLHSVSPPRVDVSAWNESPIDRFVYQQMASAGLSPVSVADPAVLIRRLHFVLTGLPPTPEEAEKWIQKLTVSKESPLSETAFQTAFEELTDQLLASPRFGERWARHWMDWIRYAESHGSEGDPEIVQAWLYRDYLIRALNDDVPVDQLIREHVAGDLLTSPRYNPALGINESAIGPAHWRMVFHGFAPTDALDEKVRFIDDQINTFTKAFLGLTVSCARCHDHKFDAISQKDYYALFGILSSCRPGRTVIDLPERQTRNREELQALKPQLRLAIADEWLASADGLAERLLQQAIPTDQKVLNASVLRPLFVLRRQMESESDVAAAISAATSQLASAATHTPTPSADDSQPFTSGAAVVNAAEWNLADRQDHAQWFREGTGLADRPSPAGEFAVATDSDRVLTGIYPAGVYSHTLSTRHAARLTSSDFVLGEDMELWVQVTGQGNSSLRYVVQDYPRSGTVYPVTKLNTDWRWQRYDVSYWAGDTLHLELATSMDAPLLAGGDSRSWFGIRRAVVQKKGADAPRENHEALQAVARMAADRNVTSAAELASVYAAAIVAAVEAWRGNTLNDEQALLLDSCLKEGLLPNSRQQLPGADSLLQEYRRLEAEIPVPVRVPGLDETVGTDQALFVRGNHKQPADPVPRRFLEAVDATPYDSTQSGRRKLANDLLRDENPLTRRVLVNRIWHHLFGQGIVSTPDNFGRLGDQPSHPELLDWLARQFQNDGWSLKKMIRRMVTSRTWQLSSAASAEALEKDPENRLLSHANVRRLEAEAIRDHLLSTSGLLQHHNPAESLLATSPVDAGSRNRSVYLQVRRNALNPFLRIFDFPEPFAAVGRRDVTNVPAQSLTMMNDPQISQYAAKWAESIPAAGSSPEERIARMFLTAFSRPATEDEIQQAVQYLASVQEQIQSQRRLLTQTQQQIADIQQQIERVTAPVRASLIEAAETDMESRRQNLTAPINRWDFSQSAADQIGSADVQLFAGAELADGSLVVRNGGYAVTKPLNRNLRAKTLEAWVQLDNLSQRAGGVMSVQTPNGVIFDAIVFAERDPRQWLAGSNGFSRTQPFAGEPEPEADRLPVHVAITYAEDGTITGYRNGQPYGQPYRSNGPMGFAAGQTVISFGVRHLPAIGNRLLSGRILKAQLYDRALTAPEIAASAGHSAGFVSDEKLMAALNDQDRRTVEEGRSLIESLQAKIEAAGRLPEGPDELAAYAELARAIFTFQEFIYLK